MRNAETVLGIIRERGRRRLPLEDIYQQLYQPDLYLRAYGRIYRNDGAMTPGSTPETVDAMSLEKIGAIIDLLRQERYRWTPVRRTYIPKQSGKLRPLGIPTRSESREAATFPISWGCTSVGLESIDSVPGVAGQ